MTKNTPTFHYSTVLAFCQEHLQKVAILAVIISILTLSSKIFPLPAQAVEPTEAQTAQDFQVAQEAQETQNTQNTDTPAPQEPSSISSDLKAKITQNCTEIHDNLQAVQRSDARIRQGLGRYYEDILSDFITPLNLRLVENNLSSATLIENQNSFVSTRTTFMNDYISYQQGLEELVSIDCKAAPEKFYEKLTIVRDLRAKVKRDTAKLKALTKDNLNLVKKLEETL